MGWISQSFRARVFVLLVGLLAAVQAVTFALVSRASRVYAVERIEEDLGAAAALFRAGLEERGGRILAIARPSLRDFSFFEVFTAGDPPTVLSALKSQRDRLGADFCALVSLEGVRVADTRFPEEFNVPFAHGDLLERAEGSEGLEATGLREEGGTLYGMVVTPLLTPDHTAWVCAGFRLDGAAAGELRGRARAEVAFLRMDEGGGVALVATMGDAGEFGRFLRERRPVPGVCYTRRDGGSGETYVGVVTPMLEGKGEGRYGAALERSLDRELAQFHLLEATLLVASVAALAVAAVAAGWVAGGVTRPVSELARGVERIERGEAGEPIPVRGRDELGRLAAAFNGMVGHLAERDRIRSLLGKVVSPAIAAELLGSREIALGGEERLVTVLFCDIRGFTSLSERMAPAETLDFLNVYLTRMTEVIENRGGVVDKYIGDAIMALYGAPVGHADDADRALLSALDMMGALGRLNGERAAAGLARIEVGIGLNTGLVVAGNMGSQSRMNYTVIGDNVNVASRLEGLTADAERGARIIVSGATLAAASGRYRTRALGAVRLKGRSEAVEIFALEGREE